MDKLPLALCAALLATPVFAGVPTTPLPEPGTFELLALGGVVAAVVAIRNRRKK
jgi:hypothetical protein